MKKVLSVVGGGAILFVQSFSSLAAAFTPGDLIVLRVGDGVTALSTAAAACYLEEYTAAGTLVQTIPMPTAVGGGNNALTLGGSSTAEGFLELSGNGQLLTLAGYNAVPGTAGPGGASISTVNRVVGVVSLNGTVDTSTSLTAGTSASLRSAFTDNGSHFWIGAAGGVSYVGTAGGSTTATLMNNSNFRVVRGFGGQLCVSSASGSSFGVSTVGSGMPTTAGQTATLLSGFPTATGPSPYDYFLAGNNLWVADDRTTGGNGGLQHWLFNGSSWSLQYTISRSATVGARGLTVDNSGAAPLFYVTTTDNKVDLIVDNGTLGTSTATTLFSDGTSLTAFRGIVYLTPVPEPTTLSFAGGFGLLLFFLRRRK
jgi:hypothetical protein